jgi:hypothetical protein
MPYLPGIYNLLHLVLLLSIDQLWGWLCKVIPMLLCFLIWCEGRGVKHIVNAPLRGQCQLKHYRGYLFCDREWTISFCIQFRLQMCEFQVCALQPDQVSHHMSAIVVLPLFPLTPLCHQMLRCLYCGLYTLPRLLQPFLAMIHFWYICGVR